MFTPGVSENKMVRIRRYFLLRCKSLYRKRKLAFRWSEAEKAEQVLTVPQFYGLQSDSMTLLEVEYCCK